MSDDLLFREVDEEVRREEIENIWKKYGTWIVAACLGVIVAVGGMKGWQFWQKQQAEAGGEAYFTAVKLAESGKKAEAEKSFSALKSSHAGYAIFGQFKQSAAKAEAGDTKGAVAAYDAISSDASVPPMLQQLATIKAAYLLADTAPLAEITKRMGAFDNPTSPWRNQARELIAVAAYRSADYQLADRKLNEILTDFQSTGGAKQRARIFLSVLKPLVTGKKTKSN